MQTFSTKIFFNIIIFLNAYELVKSIVQPNTKIVYHKFAPVSHLNSSTTNINNEWRFHNKTRVVNSFQENQINYQQNPTSNYNMKPHDHQFERPNNQHLEDKLARQTLRQILGKKPQLSQSNGYNMFDPQWQKGKNMQDKIFESSNDHLKKRYLAAEYNVPAPTVLEMPPNLHHHLPLIIYKTIAKTVSHATTGNEPSPSMTTESIKTLATINSSSDENLIFKHKFNFDKNNVLTATRSFSKQFLYSPLRCCGEKELPYASNALPYPPSFIFITTTTTEKPQLFDYNTKGTNRMPDFFTYRQFKSLWDSYIPSWQTMKFMQKFHFNSHTNNLETLAFTKEGKKKIEK